MLACGFTHPVKTGRPHFFKAEHPSAKMDYKYTSKMVQSSWFKVPSLTLNVKPETWDLPY